MLGAFPPRACEWRSHTYSSETDADCESIVLGIWGEERAEVAVEGLGEWGGD